MTHDLSKRASDLLLDPRYILLLNLFHLFILHLQAFKFLSVPLNLPLHDFYPVSGLFKRLFILESDLFLSVYGELPLELVHLLLRLLLVSLSQLYPDLIALLLEVIHCLVMSLLEFLPKLIEFLSSQLILRV